MKIILRSAPENILSLFGRRSLPAMIAVAAALVVSGCTATPAPSALAIAPPEPGTAAQNPHRAEMAAQYHVLAGELAVQRGMTKAAVKHYIAALQYTNSKELARRATRIALFAGNSAAAYKAASEWSRLAPDSLDAATTATRLAFVEGDASALPGLSRQVVALAATTDGGYRTLADIFSGRPERADLAVNTLVALAHENSDNAAAWYAAGLVALRYDRMEAASNAAQRAITLAPSEDRIVLLRAATRIRLGEPERAQALVEAMPGTAAQRSGYHMSLARLLLDSGQRSSALSEFERALELNSANTQARYGLAMVALDLGDLDRAEAALTRLYYSRQQAGQAAYYLGITNERQGDYAAAERWYKRVTTGSHTFDARVRTALVRARQGQVDAATHALERLRQQYPQMTGRLFAAQGRMLFVAKRYDDALALYDKALKQQPDNVDLLYGRSIVLEQMGQIDPAFEDLRHILELKPDGVRAMNALGYMLTNHSDRYQDALRYISKALSADPDNPAILDSMGWVQYRLGHLDRALDYLQRAYEAFRDPEVAAHLVEVLWKLDRHDQARDVWQKSLEDNPDSSLLRETMKKLTSG